MSAYETDKEAHNRRAAAELRRGRMEAEIQKKRAKRDMAAMRRENEMLAAAFADAAGKEGA